VLQPVRRPLPAKTKNKRGTIVKKILVAAALALSIGAVHAAGPDRAPAGGSEAVIAGPAGDCYLDNAGQSCAEVPGAPTSLPALQGVTGAPAAGATAAQAALPSAARPAAADPFAFITNITMSHVPEPEVFAMMLLGLCLIGFRASRDSDEKFK